MQYQLQLEQLQSVLSTVIPGVIDADVCEAAISEIENTDDNEQQQQLMQGYIKQFAEYVFASDVGGLLSSYYGEPFEWHWPTFDVVRDDALVSYESTRWHVDGGLPGMLKLFIYLNPVVEHGCTTKLLDPSRTAQLKSAGALPRDFREHLADVSEVLVSLGLPTDVTTYELSTGDAFIFDPKKLAHCCRPPKPGKKRYTLCYSVFPSSAFK